MTSRIIQTGLFFLIFLCFEIIQARSQALDIVNSTADTLLHVKNDDSVGMGTTAPLDQLDLGIIQSQSHALDIVNSTGATLLHVKDDGNVGIGTENPTAKLHIGGTAGVDGIKFPDGTLQTTAGGGGGSSPWTFSGTNIFYNTGNVGIGTTSPGAKLHLSNGENVATELTIGQSTQFGAPLFKFVPAGNNYLSLGFSDGTLVGDNVEEGLVIQRTGNVGIGTTTPGDILHVRGSSATGNAINLDSGPLNVNAQNRINFSSVGATRAFIGMVAIDATDQDLVFAQTDDGTLAEVMRLKNGNVGIGTTNPTTKLDVAGRTKTQVVEITGGSDLAEPFEMSNAETLPAGTVVVIDKDNPGKLKQATEAYNKRVAGVISGAGGVNPGLILSQEGTLDSGQYVALTGKVYALATASNGPIEPGDLLTTSDVHGHAMKVTDYTKAQGAIIGKAMTCLEKGRGLVFVLVTLQ